MSEVDASNLNSTWNTAAHTYERRLGGATHAVARTVQSLLPPLDSNSLILDSCCGTGAFTLALLNTAKSQSTPVPVIHAVDKSPGMIQIMDALIAQNGWQNTVRATEMDSQNLIFPDNTFDISVTNFGIFFYPDPIQGAKELYRTLKPDGVAYVTCWKMTRFLPNEVQKVVQPVKHVVLGMMKTWSKEETMKERLKKGGFSNVKMVSEDVMSIQENMKELFENAVDQLRVLMGEEWAEEEKMQLESATRKVLTEQREAFIVDLNDGKFDGKFGMRHIAWIAKATK